VWMMACKIPRVVLLIDHLIVWPYTSVDQSQRDIHTAGFKPNLQTNFAPILATAAKAQVEVPVMGEECRLGWVLSPAASCHGYLLSRHLWWLNCYPN
jgi:hypothetical protein